MSAFSPYQAYPVGPDPVGPSGPPPILVSVAGPVPQRRASVAFRLILAIPHLIVLWVLGIAAALVMVLGWFGALFAGRLPEFAGSFIAGYLRWTVRVIAYLFLLTDVYPPFTLDDDPAYPVRLGVPPAQPLNRAAVFFRIILGIPASIIVLVLAYGAGTLMSFIAWLATLVAGRLPGSFHLAFTAVLRYYARFNGYFWLLTPAYPGGLYGDQQGAATWADELPAAGSPGTPEPGYETPEPGYETPAPGYGTPPSVYGNPGYGNPGYGAPGYGAPGYGNPGYGAPGRVQPASWLLVLTASARRLVTVFIVLGAVLFVGYVALEAVVFGKASSGAAVARAAIPKLETSHSSLVANLTAAGKEVNACAGQLACVAPLNAAEAGYFRDFGSQLAATSLPARALPDAAALNLVTSSLTRDFTELGRATTSAQYESTVADASVQQTLADFDTDYTSLMQELSSY